MEETMLKRSVCLFVILLFAFSMVSAIPVLAQEDVGGEIPPAEEPPVEEPPAEEPPVISPEPCPSVSEPGPCEGEIVKEFDEQGCIKGYWCKPYEEPCPPEPSPIQCGPDENQIRDVDSRGCTTGYHCEGRVTAPGPCPPAPEKPPACGPDERLEADYDNRGCLIGYFCRYGGGAVACPEWKPVQPDCGMNGYPVADFDRNKCLIGWHCEYSAPAQPPEPQPEPYGCPVNDVCPDGITRPCRWEATSTGEGGRCLCDPCPPPQGCREVRDPDTGFVRTVCETQPQEQRCPDIPAEEWDKCMGTGGRPEIRRDSRGCEFISCEFKEGGGFLQSRACPSDEEMQMHKEKCKSMGMADHVERDGDCYVVRCVRWEGGQMIGDCPPITFEQKESVYKRCESIGKTVTQSFDEQGCIYLKCAEEGECLRLPPDAFRRCEERGGELVAKDDENGCVVWHECVIRGNEGMMHYETPGRMPETTELLDIAFKLESLKIELDKLARKSDDIAQYYESTGSPEAERFRRVADMFETAKHNVDEIKEKIRDRLEDITMDDIMEIRHDIKYMKDVIMKDILYLMLSSGDDIKERIESGKEGSCGTDGMCFDNAIRVCEPVKFLPEGHNGPIVNIAGLEGDACIMKVRLPEGQGPPGAEGPLEMTCKIQNYAMGVRGPEDIMPYCEGPLKDIMEQYGIEPGGPQPGPAGPGGELIMCTIEGEKAMKECGYRGGMPQSDPSPDGKCEIFTGCEMPELRSEPAYPGPYQPGPASGGGGGALKDVIPCSGCLDNGICDIGECSECPDCIGGGGFG